MRYELCRRVPLARSEEVGIRRSITILKPRRTGGRRLGGFYGSEIKGISFGKLGLR